jgi:hypothetical protein
LTNKKADVPLCDNHAVTMFYACALDLLAQTEVQHRAVLEAHNRLERCIAEWRINPPTADGRQDRLSRIADVVREVVATVQAQRTLVIDMQRALSALQTNGGQS